MRLRQAVGPVHFHPGDLTGVMFGHRVSEATIQRIRECTDIGGSKPIFYKARVDRAQAKLVMERI